MALKILSCPMFPGEPAFFGVGVHATMCLRKRLWYLRNCILCIFVCVSVSVGLYAHVCICADACTRE